MGQVTPTPERFPFSVWRSVPRDKVDLQRFLGEKRLPEWLTAAQSVDLHLLLLRVHFTADETMGPVGRNVQALSTEHDCSRGVQAAEQHNAINARGSRRGGPRHARDTISAVRLGSIRIGHHERIAAPLQGRQIAVSPAPPHPLLPSSVVGLNGGLEPKFAWGRKDWHDADTKTPMDEAAEIRPLRVRTGEDRVIVALQELWTTFALPSELERPNDRVRGDPGGGSRCGRATPQRQGVQGFDPATTREA